MSLSWMQELNSAQREAVAYGEGPLLVVAGAGTGKTKTLAGRVASLIDRGVNPDRIMLLTFTRRAAAQMISRVRHMAGTDDVNNVWGGTFHAIANRLLRIYGNAINLPTDFTVMDQGDAADLLHMIRNELGFGKGKRRFAKKMTLLKIYSHTVNAQVPLRDVLERYYPWCTEEATPIGEIFKQYARYKLKQHVVDYDDLLLYWRMLCRDSSAAKTIADRFEHILIDEYQDTNPIQGDIVREMRKTYDNVMAVGDDAQSIYSFRAATIRNILDFPETFPGTHVVTLEENYRSTQPILAASNAVMDQAKQRYTKNLRSDRSSEQLPILMISMDEPEQCNAVCDAILDHREQGIELTQQAVLFRASYHSAQLEIELSRRNIPFHKYGGLRYVETAHVKDVLAMLRILENPYDEMGWFRILQLLDGIGPRTAKRLLNQLVGAQSEPSENEDASTQHSPLLRLFCTPPQPPAASKAQFDELRKALAECCGLKVNGKVHSGPADIHDPQHHLPLNAQIERIRHFYEPVCEKHYDNATARLRDIEQLEAIATGYRSRRRFITDLALDPPNSTAELAHAPHLDEDYLILSTIHSAKGCEWTSVHIIHAADGMIPSDMAVADEAGIEEERRLFYVAMTRAKDYLFVHFPLRYYHTKFRRGDAHNYAQLTRYMAGNVKRHFEERAPEMPYGSGEGSRRSASPSLEGMLDDLF